MLRACVAATTICVAMAVSPAEAIRGSGPYGRLKNTYPGYEDYDDFPVDTDLLENHKLGNAHRREVVMGANSRQGYVDYDTRYTRRTGNNGYGGAGSYSGGGGHGGGGHGGGGYGGGGHGGGGYGGGGGGGYGAMMGGIDLYSILALGIFATFLGYVVFYYISVNGGGRSFSPLINSEDLGVLMGQVTDALERWAVLDFLSKRTPRQEETRVLQSLEQRL